MAGAAVPVPLSPSRPGVSKKDSLLAMVDRWVACDKVRFVDGKPEKIGGHEALTVTSVDDPIRGMKTWSTQRLEPFIMMGTSRKLYVVDQSYDPVDITPIEVSGTLTDPFSTVDTSTEVDVLDTDHLRAVGDTVIFDNAVAVGGITIDGAYVVMAIVDEDHYTIEHTSAATSTAGPGGGTVDYEYELTTGTINPLEGNGYGAGGYGLGDYGEGAPAGESSIIFEPRVWSLDNYGDLMLCNPLNGGIYEFDPADTPAYVRPALIANAPEVVRSIFVTPERFIFALGADNDPMNIQWPDQDDRTDWTPSATNTANSRRLREGTRIIAGIGVANLLSGVWTDTAMYAFQYTGSSFIYDSRLVGTACGLVSPLAVVVRLGVAYWMSQNGFFYWSGGSPQPIPNSEDIREYVVQALRTGGYEFKCNAHFNARYNEIWWFYVSDDESEPSLYVAVSLSDYSWVVGEMTRTSGDFFKNSDQAPILATEDGYLMSHEVGKDADGEVMKAFITRAPMQLLQGSQLGEIQGVICDFQRQVGTITIEVKTFDRINEGVLEIEREDVEPGEDLNDFRIGGRIASITISSAELGGDFRLGAPMLEVKTTGKRR